MTTEPRRPFYRRKRRLAAGLLWLAVAYPASFPPAAYLAARGGLPFDLLLGLYRPIVVCTSGRPVASEPAFVTAYRESVNDLWRLGERHRRSASN